MPWLAIPFKDARIRALSSRFEVEGIPAFVILDAAGNIINKEARGSIVGDPEGTKFPFYPEPVEDISVTLESFGCDINSKPAVIAFMESADDSEQAAAKAVLGNNYMHRRHLILLLTLFFFSVIWGATSQAEGI